MEPMTTIALRAARKAGDLIVRASDELDRVGHQAKGAADFVTEVDIACEQESSLTTCRKRILTTHFTARKVG